MAPQPVALGRAASSARSTCAAAAEVHTMWEPREDLGESRAGLRLPRSRIHCNPTSWHSRKNMLPFSSYVLFCYKEDASYWTDLPPCSRSFLRTKCCCAATAQGWLRARHQHPLPHSSSGWWKRFSVRCHGILEQHGVLIHRSTPFQPACVRQHPHLQSISN